MDSSDTPDYQEPNAEEEDNSEEIVNLSLQIQLAATAVATSFLLIFIPNVETISFTAFLVGFLFPLPFAVVTIITMTITWEIFASMVFAFSGFTFPFKIIAWLGVGLLGNLARKIKARYFYEFAIFGAISAFLFDLMVTIPTSFIFLGDKVAFLTVVYTNLVFGVLFTVSHTLSNALLFGFLPVILRSLLPLFEEHYPHLLQIPANSFDYLIDQPDSNYSLSIMLLSKRRLAGYGILAILIVATLGFGAYSAISPQPQQPKAVEVGLSIDYAGIKSTETFNLTVYSNMSLLDITQQVAVVNYTSQYGQPYVQAINNVWQDQNRTNYYWLIYINGQFSQEGASIIHPDSGDSILWVYSD